MLLNPEIYNVDNLKDEDKRLMTVVDKVSENVLNESTVDAFIESKNVTTTTLHSIYKEVLNDFITFLRVQLDFCKTDMIIDIIDEYGKDDLANAKDKHE